MAPGILAVPLLAQTGLSLWQAYQANQMKQNRPFMPIPQEEYDKLSMAKRDYSQTENPYASTMREDIGGATSQGIAALERGSKSGSDILSGVERMALSGQNAERKIGESNIAYKINAGKTLTGALTDMQNAKQMQWNYNIGQPYEKAMAARSALLGGAQQNAMNALWSGASIAYAGGFGAGAKTTPNTGQSLYANGFTPMDTPSPLNPDYNTGQVGTVPFNFYGDENQANWNIPNPKSFYGNIE